MFMKNALYSGLAAVGLTACSVGTATSENVGAETQELVAGQIDTKHTFAVGVCQGSYNTDPAAGPIGTCRKNTAGCSGTLVGPNLVLTARHCVQNVDYGPGALSGQNPCDVTFNANPIIAGGTHVTTSPSIYIGSPKWYEVAEVLVPPAGNGLCTDDLALLVLARSVPSNEARPVGIDANRDLARRRPAEVAVVGRGAVSDHFGLDANGDWTGEWTLDDGDLVRRVQQHIPFLCATNGPKGCPVVSHEVPTTHVFPTPRSWYVVGGGSLGSGDSGSAIFDQREFDRPGRAPRVIGVNTWAFIDANGNANPNAGIRLDGFKDFLRNGIQRAATAGGYRRGCDIDSVDAD